MTSISVFYCAIYERGWVLPCYYRKADNSSERVNYSSPNNQWCLSQVLQSKQNLSDSDWGFEPTTSTNVELTLYYCATRPLIIVLKKRTTNILASDPRRFKSLTEEEECMKRRRKVDTVDLQRPSPAQAHNSLWRMDNKR